MTQTEEIKARIDVVPFIEGYVRLAKAGANFKALCPFHNERTPSFMVSPARQTWHCFGCGKGGDIFSFLMEIEGLEFPEALKILAERAGIELRREAPQIRSERTRLLTLLEDATRFYELNLRRHAEVGGYLKNRGLTGETAKTFRVGFAEDRWDGLLDYLAGKGYRPQEAEKAGLVICKSLPARQAGPIANRQSFNDKRFAISDKRYYDRFRNRIMFPIADSAGRIVGFSGRIFEFNEVEPRKNSYEVQPPVIAAKYINTPQTLLYDKSKLLYVFDKAKQEIRKQNTCILVEGQMDALMAHQAGTKNAVAVSGTALTPLHLRQIRRLCGSLVFAFDPDAAGITANRRGIELAYEAGFEEIKIAPLSSGNDPADIIAGSPARWEEILGQAKESIAFFLEVVPQERLSEVVAKNHAAYALFPLVGRIESHVARAHWLQYIARYLRLPEESIASEFALFLKKTAQERHSSFDAVHSPHTLAPPFQKPTSRRGILEERLFGLLLLRPHLVSGVSLELNHISPYHNPYSIAFLDYLGEGTDWSALSVETRQEASRLMTAVEREGLFTDEEVARREIVALLAVLQQEIAKERLTAIRVALAEAERQGNREEQERLLHQFSHLIKTYNTYEQIEKEKTNEIPSPSQSEAEGRAS